MDMDFAKALSVAIAKANGHPDPEAWAANVAGHLEPAPAEPTSADPAPAEPEQPAP
jgi:hypothetical protein